MKIAIINDTHCGIRNSSDIFIEYQRRFYNEVFFPYLIKHGIKQILHLGDYYDNRKTINFKVLEYDNNTFIDSLRKNGISMDIILGNHDVYYKNTNKLNSLNELLGHHEFINVIAEPMVKKYGSTKIALLPWINDENYDESIDFIRNCKSDILAAHLEINGFLISKNFRNKHGLEPSLLRKFSRVWSGHYHTASERDNIKYLGTQMQFTWEDEGEKKYFHVFDTEKNELTCVENPITIYHKIVYDDSVTNYDTCTEYCDDSLLELKHKIVKVVVKNKTDLGMFERFLNRLQKIEMYQLQIAEVFNEFIGENVDTQGVSVEDTTTLLDTYVDNSDTNLDKNRLKEFMRNLYNDALNINSI